jgi:hypothetical protein
LRAIAVTSGEKTISGSIALVSNTRHIGGEDRDRAD